MRSLLSGSGGLLVLASSSLLSIASATLQTCQNPTSAFDKDSLSPGCCTSWITKRDLGAVPSNFLLGRTDEDCATSTCCEKKKTLVTLDKTASDIQCGSKFNPSDLDGDTPGGVQYSLGPCTTGDTSKTCLGITVTPVKSGGGCYTLASNISVYIDDASDPPDTSSGNWNFGNSQGKYCTLKTAASSGCQYWSCEFEQSLWDGNIKTPGSDGICGNTIAVGVHFGIGSATCTQGQTGLNYGSGNNFFQYEKITFNCKDICDTTSLCCCPCNSDTHCCPGDTYCGDGVKPANKNCEPVCCPGQTRCDTPLCTNNPTPNCCPKTENYCGTNGLKMNKDCEPACCEGDTRCNNPACTSPDPPCCPEKENYCGTGGLLLNKKCTPECCEGDDRCGNSACTTGPDCCVDKENYCGTGGLVKNTKCTPTCCEGDTRCNNPACTTGPDCCPEKENYCGTGGLVKNTKCTPTCCGGTCCEDKLCCNPPSDWDFCPQPQCQYGTGWGWLRKDVDDKLHFVNNLTLCTSKRWGEWFNISSLPFFGDLVVGRGNNDPTKGDVVGTVSLSEDTSGTVKACFDITKSNAHITSVHVELSCDDFNGSNYKSSKKNFNLCAPGQWKYKFPASGCLDWVASQYNICIKGITKCPAGIYYAIYHAAVTKNADGSCTPTTSCWTDS